MTDSSAVADLLTKMDKPTLSDHVLSTRAELLNQLPRPDSRLAYRTYDGDVAVAEDIYDPTDFKTVGRLIKDNVAAAISARFPVVGDKYTLAVENVKYETPKNTALADEKYALQHEQSVSDRLRGDWVLYDNATGKEIQRKHATLLNVPRMTERGTFIRNGSEQGLKHMFRLRPGIYARIKGDGHPSVHINPAQLTGRQMSLDLDPETGIMIAKRGTRTYGMLPLLKAAGISDDAIKAAWGEDLYKTNLAKYGKMMSPDNKVFQEYQTLYNDELSPIKLDEETTELTMGTPYATLTPEALLQSSNKLLKLSRSMSADDEDDRDSLAYQRVMGPADYIPERIVRDGGGLLRKMFQRVVRDGNLDSIESGAFQPQVDSVFLEDKHAAYIDGASPFEALDLNSMVSRIGEGGIGDIKAAPAETRGVNDSYLGFIDPIRCFTYGTQLATKDGWVAVQDMNENTEFACMEHPGNITYNKPKEVNSYKYRGPVIWYCDDSISFQVTPQHRMVVIPPQSREAIVAHVEYLGEIMLACNLYEDRNAGYSVILEDGTVHNLIPDRFEKRLYNGIVYCPTVPGGKVISRYYEQSKGFWIGQSPESLKVGLDVYLTYGTRKDSKGRLYANFRDKTGSTGYRPMDTIARSIVATPEFYDPMADPMEFIPAFNKGKQIDYVRRKDVDFFLTSSNNMMSIGAGTIPNIGGIRSNRTLMGCLHPDTELLVKNSADTIMHMSADELLKSSNTGERYSIHVLNANNTGYNWQEIRQVLRVEPRQLFRVYTEDGNVARVTDNHKWLTKGIDGELSLVQTSGLLAGVSAIPKATINGGIKWVVVTCIGVVVPVPDYVVDIDVNDGVYMLANGLFTHNSKYPLQALSLEKREAPLVQRKMDADGVETTTERVIAKQLGAKFAPVDGRVISVSADEIVIRDREGQKHTIELYNNYPANQKGFLNNTPLVEEGQRVHANDILAKSNYTTDTGEAALGVNLRTAFVPAKGSANFEDAIVISETAAKKLASEQMHKFRGDLSSDTEYGKKKYLSLFGAGEYTQEQLDKIADNGMPEPGTVFKKGDPVFLGTQIRDLSTSGLSRRASVPYVKTWEHEEPGTVMDVVKGKKHMVIYTKSYTPMRPGDKMCFDDQTEVLTDSGWKFFKDILIDDKVLTIDYHTGESRFVDYSDAYSYDVVDEKMYTLKTKRLDICTTKGHRHLVSCMNNSSYLTLKTSDEIFGKRIYHLVGLDLDSRYNFAGSKDDNPKEKWTKYTGKVYCITVPDTHTMYVRRNGKAVWSGNSGRYGAKGVCSKVLPDNEMPTDSHGRPMEVLMTPLSLPSRLNTAMLGELQLSKIAESRGRAYNIPDFITDDTIDGFVSKELKKYGIPEKEDLYDPVTGKTIPQVSTGLLYNYKLKHMAELKERGRGTGIYTSEDVPMKGEGAARRLGMMEVSAVYSGGGMDVLRDAKLIRGQRNDDFWHDYKEGLTPQMPTTPLVHKKFISYLRASGANIQRNGDQVHMYAATDEDMKDLTGNRKVTSASTFDSKNMHPIEGGLFDPKIFGSDGDQWGYVELPEPVLNPLMFKPIASIMGWTDKELTEYLQGARHVQGDFGPVNLIDKLNSMDLKAELKKAKDLLKAEGRTTIAQRDLARKRIRAIEPMLREGKKPSDFFFTRMPILPPKFRTVTTIVDETNVAADANFLYKRMMDAASDLQAARESLPEEFQVDARESLYNAVNAVVGTMPTDDPKLEAKGVGGLLKWAFGKGSPKQSSAHRKIFGANLDMGGLGTITPDGDLSIDEVGIPEESAWKMFEPFVLRDLRQSGFSTMNAMREVMERTPEARRSLERQMEKRPILINRAPTLWRYGIQGQYAKIVKDNSIHVNPNICKSMNADFDGNCVDFDSKIIVKLSKSALDFFERNDYINSSVKPNNKEVNMGVCTNAVVAANDVAEGLQIMSIGEFPRIGDSYKDKNGADVYGVPHGVEILTTDPITGESKFCQVSQLTEEFECDTVEILAGGRTVIASTNPTVAVFEPAEGTLVKVAAEEHNNRLIPMFKKLPLPMGSRYDRDFGWWIGAMVSDGWISDRVVGYTKLEKCKRDAFLAIARNICVNFTCNEYAAKAGDGKLGDSVKLHLYSQEFADLCRSYNIYSEGDDSTDGKKSSLRKQISMDMLLNGSEEFLFGLLSGLLDGDGSFTKNMTTGKPRFSAKFSTSSKALRESVEFLLYRLGIRYTTTVTPPRNWSNEAYNICPSTTDMYYVLDKLTCIGERELTYIDEWKNYPPAKDDIDVIPISSKELNTLRKSGLNKVSASLYSALSKGHRCCRSTAIKHIEFIKPIAPEFAARLENTNTIWAPIKALKPAGKRTVYDVTVPDTKVFSVNNGITIYDSMSTHVPVSNEAIEAIKENMLPSKNLISPQSGKAHFIPRDGANTGLYLASRMGKGTPVRFRTEEEAEEAYRKGLIKIDTPIEIG